MYNKFYFILFYVLLFPVWTFSSITLTSTSPSIVDSSSPIDAFEIKLVINDVSKISLGDVIDIKLPYNLPYLSSKDIDDGKLYVRSIFKNGNDIEYKNAAGIKLSIYEHTISIKITSKLRTFTKNDIYENLLPMANNDTIVFEISSSSDITNKANIQYSGDESINVTSSSPALEIINEMSSIVTPVSELKITNPSVVFDRKGLGARSNPRFSFFFKGGLPKDSRIEIIFPDGFDITGLHNLSNYIVLNKKYKTSNSITDGQKLSFTLDNDISEDNIYIDLTSYRVSNTVDPTVAPFEINIYKNEEIYSSFSVYPTLKDENTYFVNHNFDEYSLDDEIHIEFSAPIVMSIFDKNKISVENSKNGRTFGENYKLQAVDGEYGYASKFKIMLDFDANLTKGLDINISKEVIVTREGYKPLKDLVFKVPNITTGKPSKSTKTILETHTQLFASSEIDMLYEALNDSMPDRAVFNDIVFQDKDESGTYSQSDKLIVSFSKPVYAPYLKDMSNILSVHNSINFGTSATMETYNKENRSLYHDKYIITLGFAPSLPYESIFAFNRTRILGEDGSIPTYDVSFSPIPSLEAPSIKLENTKVVDSDSNGKYSSGDKISLTFTQPIKSISLENISLLSGASLDIKSISYQGTQEGYSIALSINLGDKTQALSRDYISIPKNIVINKHGIKAGLLGSIRVPLPSLAKPQITNTSYNPISSTLHLEFNGNLTQINKNEILKKILLTYENSKHKLSSLGNKLVSFAQSNNNMFIVFDKEFISSLSEAKLDISIPKSAIALAESSILNEEIKLSFYTTIKIANLVPNKWNLVALEDKLVDTNIKNIKATNQVHDVYIFSKEKIEWIATDSTDVKRGMAIWLNPKENTVENIVATRPKTVFEEKTTTLNDILYMRDNQGYYLGNSVKNCDTGNNFTALDIKPILLDKIKVKLVSYDAEHLNYKENVDFIKPCKGFLIIKEDIP